MDNYVFFENKKKKELEEIYGMKFINSGDSMNDFTDK
jgi:hypothetical protein